MTAPDILTLPLRANIEGLKETLSPLQQAVERYLVALDVAARAAYGDEWCEASRLGHHMERVRRLSRELYRLDEQGQPWGAVGDLEEELVQLAGEDEQRVQHVMDERREVA